MCEAFQWLSLSYRGKSLIPVDFVSHQVIVWQPLVLLVAGPYCPSGREQVVLAEVMNDHENYALL